MGRRLTGSLVFLGTAIYLFEIARRLASDQREGWGWFLFAGLMLSAVSVNLWTGEVADARGKEPAPRDGWDTQ